MGVLRFRLTADVAEFGSATAVRIAPLRHRGELDPLVEACRLGDPAGQRLVAPGLAAELTGRPGRTVHAWLARPEDGSEQAVGLASLVETGGGRFSIAWLLVDPARRRSGVATALVRHAVAHARSRGAAEVWADTLSTWPEAIAFWQALAARHPAR